MAFETVRRGRDVDDVESGVCVLRGGNECVLDRSEWLKLAPDANEQLGQARPLTDRGDGVESWPVAGPIGRRGEYGVGPGDRAQPHSRSGHPVDRKRAAPREVPQSDPVGIDNPRARVRSITAARSSAAYG